MHNQCAEELRRRFFATGSTGSLSRLTSASNALCPGCGRQCDRARQGPASSPAPAYIGAQRGGFPSALPARRRPEGFCVPTPRSGRTEERPRLSIAASHSIEGGRGPQHARRQPAAFDCFEWAPPASGAFGRAPSFRDSLSEMSASKGETTYLISESRRSFLFRRVPACILVLVAALPRASEFLE